MILHVYMVLSGGYLIKIWWCILDIYIYTYISISEKMNTVAIVFICIGGIIGLNFILALLIMCCVLCAVRANQQSPVWRNEESAKRKSWCEESKEISHIFCFLILAKSKNLVLMWCQKVLWWFYGVCREALPNISVCHGYVAPLPSLEILIHDLILNCSRFYIMHISIKAGSLWAIMQALQNQNK